MKKKVLIVSHAMELGGAERALLALLNSFDYEKYDVELFLFSQTGELFDLIPKKVVLINEKKQYSTLEIPLISALKKGAIGTVFGRCLGIYNSKKYCKKHNVKVPYYVGINYSNKYTVPFMPKISNKEYDVAISFLTPHYFVDKKVNAKKKIAWIHTDYSSVEIDQKTELKMWSKFDNIISISENVTNSFLKVFPTLEDKIVLIENIIDEVFINSQADAFSVEEEMPSDSIKLLSIGRFCDAKNFDNVPEMMTMLLSKGYNVKWYLIGFGIDENKIKRKIDEFNMHDNVVILGKKANPYPYIKSCDYYLQPSRYEGKSVSIREAQILHKPVAIANFSTAKSQLIDGHDGLIFELENAQFVDGISKLINDSDLKEKLINATKSTIYTNKYEINKLYKLF